MAVPNDRRVIYGAHVVPQEAIVREEGATTYKLDTTVAKRFGGKGSVDITPDQGTDYWTSMASLGQNWNLFDETWNGTVSTWDTGAGEVTVDDSLSRIMPGSATTAVKFLYVKNLGSEECQLALEGDEPDILIPPGAAVSMRTTSTVTLATAKVAVASGADDTTIEYVIAI
tara:strand:- start:612 stop:1124 length:513 start_codon:yes stop_codon:yes gene_type:complete